MYSTQLVFTYEVHIGVLTTSMKGNQRKQMLKSRKCQEGNYGAAALGHCIACGEPQKVQTTTLFNVGEKGLSRPHNSLIKCTEGQYVSQTDRAEVPDWFTGERKEGEIFSPQG